MSNYADVKQFNDLAGNPAGSLFDRANPTTLQAIRNQWSLIREELLDELLPAMEDYVKSPTLENLADVADGLVDVEYVILGMHRIIGLPHQRLFDAVHTNNMTKIADGVRRNSEGKILKPANYKPVDLLSILIEDFSTQARKVQR